jgi:hypothetical protein
MNKAEYIARYYREVRCEICGLAESRLYYNEAGEVICEACIEPDVEYHVAPESDPGAVVASEETREAAEAVAAELTETLGETYVVIKAFVNEEEDAR